MIRLTDKMKAVKVILADKKGESLVESVVSIAIFTMLMMAVAVMINASLRITRITTTAAKDMQDSINNAVFENYTDLTPSAQSLNLVSVDTNADGDELIDVSIPVSVGFADDGTIVAFFPD